MAVSNIALFSFVRPNEMTRRHTKHTTIRSAYGRFVHFTESRFTKHVVIRSFDTTFEVCCACVDSDPGSGSVISSRVAACWRRRRWATVSPCSKVTSASIYTISYDCHLFLLLQDTNWINDYKLNGGPKTTMVDDYDDLHFGRQRHSLKLFSLRTFFVQGCCT